VFWLFRLFSKREAPSHRETHVAIAACLWHAIVAGSVCLYRLLLPSAVAHTVSLRAANSSSVVWKDPHYLMCLHAS